MATLLVTCGICKAQAQSMRLVWNVGMVGGANPANGLILGRDGFLYATTLHGVADLAKDATVTNNTSTIVKYQQLSSGSAYQEAWAAAGGSTPYMPLNMIQGGDGNFYGTILDNENEPGNVIFRLTSNYQPGDGPSFATSYVFSIFANPLSASDQIGDFIVQASDGSFYEMYGQGGTNLLARGESSAAVGCGSIYRVDTNGAVQSMFSFKGTNGNAGDNPLMQGSDGAIYGMTEGGGNGFVANATSNVFPSKAGSGYGTIFRLNVVITPTNVVTINSNDVSITNLDYTTNVTFTNLFSFSGSNGCDPQYCGLVQANDGSLYGVTTFGGLSFQASAPGAGNGYGTVFRISTNGVFTLLHQFRGSNDGAQPSGTLLQASDGYLYGLTYAGGLLNMGTAFRVSTNGQYTSLASFTEASGGPPSSYGQKLVQTTNGTIFGAVENSPLGGGGIFELDPGSSASTNSPGSIDTTVPEKISVSGIAYIQAASTDNNITTKIHPPTKVTITTALLLKQLALDEQLTAFPNGAKLMFTGTNFEVVQGTTVYDVSDVLTWGITGQYDVNTGSYSDNNGPGIAPYTETNYQRATLTYDDSNSTGDMMFSVTGLATFGEKASKPNSASGQYTQTDSITLQDGTGDGIIMAPDAFSRVTGPFVISGFTISASGSASLNDGNGTGSDSGGGK